MTLADHVDTSLIAQLRRQLAQTEDERDAQARAIASLNTELGHLRAALQAELETLDPETAQAEAKASRFWFAAWKNGAGRNAEHASRIVKLEQWLREYGTELALLQTKNRLLQAIADAVRASKDTARIGEVQVHFDGMSGGLHAAIDYVSKGPTNG